MTPCHIVLIQPHGCPATRAFWDIALLLRHSLASLGVPCTFGVNRFNRSAVNIVLGYNMMTDVSPLRENISVIYQFEQLTTPSGWFSPGLLHILKQAQIVWDYDLDNIDVLASHGIHAQWMPVGYHEKLETIEPVDEDVDVLFYGTLNPRRKKILGQLEHACNVVALDGCYGPARDRWIARARIVLNLHYYEAPQTLEQARLAYLLNNSRFVVSEESADNPYEGGIAAVPYEQLADACLYYLKRPDERTRIASAGRERLAQQPMSEQLRAPLRRLSNLVELAQSGGALDRTAPSVSGYYRCLNQGLLAAIPADARTVVEFGCGGGMLGQAFKQRYPKASYLGIEMNEAAASFAAGHLDAVVLADVEKLGGLEADWIGQADCLVYGDVLEHLVDPWRALREHVCWLRPGGQVVASIPNVQHWSILQGLFAGRWQYQDAGLLDRTHLRFFTAESIQALFEDAGLDVQAISPLSEQAIPGHLHSPLAKLVAGLGEEYSSFLRGAQVYQYLVHASKAALLENLGETLHESLGAAHCIS